ncbi:MAG: hypothetical protein IT443_01900 [Phycisphaeraceae bacterium]|nr:hypothetical protein [Phycisphaeraceae bacterium]
MSKHQMIEVIRSHNPSAAPDFLLHFNEQQLDRYVRRLTSLLGHRGPHSIWVRDAETPAIVSRVV